MQGKYYYLMFHILLIYYFVFYCSSPFLGQGANQAIQDAYCLTSLIYKYNHNEEYAPRKELSTHKQIQWKRPLIFYPFALLLYPVSTTLKMLGWLGWITRFMFHLTLRRPFFPTKLQRMVYEYESIRKSHNAWLTVTARVLGFMECLGGEWGLALKCNFFRVLNWTGLGKWLFLSPMNPAV
jgi:hypothetical protein